ncbi:MAG: Mur ligase family protein [Caldisericia bacterium]|nr:Mur ligase family protein [Caldisericia bacterium]
MIIIETFIKLSIFIITFLILLLRILWYLQVLQILEYFNIKYLRHLFKRSKDYIFDDIVLIILIILISLSFLLKINRVLLNLILLIFLFYSLFYNFNLYKKRKKFSKKGLKFTKRCKRIFILTTIFLLIVLILIYLNHSLYLTPYLIFLSPFILLILNILIYPIESLINEKYFNDAIKIIKEYKPFIIVITGSYGKTSTKYFIYELLKDNFKTQMTPESYNTAMGITKFIRENLKNETEIFVVELAENEKGGFKRLLRLIEPNILVITSIGIQHLEEFGTKEKIFNEFKYLIEYSISSNKCEKLILNGDDEFLKNFQNEKISKISIYKGNYPFIEIIEETLYGTKFKTKFLDFETFFETKLVGLETIRNLLIAIEVAINFKIDIEKIIKKVKILEPFNHRLNVLKSGNVIVVDDAYNSNPIGARMAIDLISKYKEGRKIIITPGFIELGKSEYEENKNLGKYLLNKVDYVFLVGGKRIKPIYEGLKEVGFKLENISIFKNFYEANNYLKNFIKPNDIILFENDLPEIYEEL